MLISDDLPSSGSSVLYATFGYDKCYIGQTRDGIIRVSTTQDDKPWISVILWFDLAEWGCEKTKDREHVEALVINKFSNVIRSPDNYGSGITLQNRLFKKSLGRFENRPKTRAVQRMANYAFNVFIEYIYENPDPRGNATSYAKQFISGPSNHTQDLCRHLQTAFGTSSRPRSVSYKKVYRMG